MSSLTAIREWPRITRGENEGDPRFERVHELMDYWVLRIGTNAKQLNMHESHHPRGGSWMMRGDSIFSYGSHFELARILRTKGGNTRLVLLNGDVWGGGSGFGNSTSGQQVSLRSYMEANKVPHAVIPFSALSAAGIEYGSIEIIENRPSRYTYHDMRGERPGPYAMVESGRTEPREVTRHGWTIDGKPVQHGGDGATYGAYTVMVEQPIMVEDQTKARVERTGMEHAWADGNAELQSDGTWTWRVQRHWLGECLLKGKSRETRLRLLTKQEREQADAASAVQRKVRETRAAFEALPVMERTYDSAEWQANLAATEESRGTRYPDGYMDGGSAGEPKIRHYVTRTAYYLSAFDYGEPHRPYFMCELPKSIRKNGMRVQVWPTTVEQALDDLMPDEVRQAIASGLEVVRQGDVFAIPTAVTTDELKSRAVLIDVTKYEADVHDQIVPVKHVEPIRSKQRDGQKASVLGTNHSPTHAILTTDGDWYGRGRMYHTPVGWGRTPDHRVKKLGDGKVWHRLVKNTVPLDEASGSSRGSVSAGSSGAARAVRGHSAVRWTDMAAERRSFNVGTIKRHDGLRTVLAVVISLEDGRLSIVGSHIDGGGQCIDMLTDESFEPYAGWADRIERLVEIWERWHLNDMRAGCEHQRAAGWSERPIDPFKPTKSYGLHYEGQTNASWNMLGWVRPSEHPEGLLTKPCPECGYEYGSAWLREELPDDVLATLRDWIGNAGR